MIAALTVAFSFLAPPSPADSSIATLAWTAVGDDGQLGTAARYEMEAADTVYVLDQVPLAAGSPERADWRIYAPTVFRVRAIDDADNAAPWSNAVTASPSAPSDTYQAYWHDAYTGDIVLKSPWGGPNGFSDGYRAPRPPGEPDTVWIVFTESVPQMGLLEIVRVADSGEWSGPYPLGQMATFARTDTLMAWQEVTDPKRFAWAHVEPYPGKAWSWSRYNGPPSRLVSQSVIQWAWRERLCEIFGYYGMAGGRAPCE